MNRTYLVALIIIIILVIIILVNIAYQNQQNLIFLPDKLPQDHKFYFDILQNNFQEHWIQVDERTKIHGVLFQEITDEGIPPICNNPNQQKGLVLYLHGNTGNVAMWGNIAPVFTYQGYDIFILDYRGYGKSEGKITSQDQLFNDVQIVYDYFKKLYREEDIVLSGYSIGTGIAAHLASKNHPRMLILNAPYYSLTRLIQETYSFIPNLMIAFKLETYKYIQELDCPVYLFHSVDDDLIPVQHSKDLAKLFNRPEDELFILGGVGHSHINQSKRYQRILGELLN